MAETIFDPLLALSGNFAAAIGPNFLNLILYTIGMAVYAIFIWHFYKFIGRRDIFKWDTEKFARASGFGRLGQAGLYFAKYLVAYPVLVFVWFGVFSTFMFVLGQNIDTQHVLLISFALVTSIRVMAYYSEELSYDVAKLVPLALLGVYIVQPAFLNIDATARVFDLASFVGDILKFTAFSVAAEWFLRIVWDVKQKLAPHTHVPGNVVERFGR